MSARMEYKGVDVEEAIRNACAALKLTREELAISIVSTGSSGIFGLGRKKAVIRVALRKEVDQEEQKAVIEKKKEGRGRRSRGECPEPEKEKAADAAEHLDPEPAKGDPVSPEEIEDIRADLTRLLSLMGCPSAVSVTLDENNRVHAGITGEFVERIVGPEGQTIDSIQYLMRKIITRKFPQRVLFALDAGGFRESRVEELRDRALRLAEEVKKTGKTKTIPAISPGERRVVHMALQDDIGIRSRSVGEGLYKKVLIYLPGKGRRSAARKDRTGA